MGLNAKNWALCRGADSSTKQRPDISKYKSLCADRNLRGSMAPATTVASVSYCVESVIRARRPHEIYSWAYVYNYNITYGFWCKSGNKSGTDSKLNGIFLMFVFFVSISKFS